jgi:RHS repeat-associated protein
VQRDLTGTLAPLKGSITSITDPLGNATSYGYDQFNNLASLTDASGAAAAFTYDALGNVTSITDPLGHTTTLTYNGVGELTGTSVAVTDLAGPGSILETLLSYDPNGNLALVTDPLQNTTRYTHNFRGRLTRVEDALGGVTSLEYGASGCSTCNGAGEKPTALTDPMGSRSSFAYDKRGLLTSSKDPLGHETVFAYDSMGRLQSRTDRNGDTLAYGYDGAGRLASITYPDATSVSYSYDALGRLTGVQDGSGSAAYGYDGAGRVTGLTNPYGMSLGYAYDGAGNLTEIVYPEGSPLARVRYAYDALGRLETIVLTTSGGAQAQASASYDAAGNLTGYTHFNGIQASYAYDEANRTLSVTEAGISSYRFTLDGNGSRREVVSTEPLGMELAPESLSYAYDSTHRLLLSAGSVPRLYDGEGQLSQTGSVPYVFDSNHRLSAIGSDVSFAYDGVGMRLSAVRGGVVTRYLYDPWGNCMAETDGSNQITRAYAYGLGLSAMVGSDGSIYCYHFDALGSVIALTDMHQTIVNAYAYDPFGRLREQEALAQPFKYVGRYGVMHEPNGLYYMRARYYDPSVGRFISEDPIGFAGGDVNLYGYVQNDPVNLVDPFGLDAIYIHYDGYPVDTGYGFKLNLGHGGVVAVDPKTGQTRYFEFGRYGDKCGMVRSPKIPNVKIGKDGLPTQESLQALYGYLSKNLGKGSQVSPVYYSDSGYQGTIDFAEKFSKSHPCYDVWDNNCKTFAKSAASACKEEQPCK